jgi:hypothetical protein
MIIANAMQKPFSGFETAFLSVMHRPVTCHVEFNTTWKPLNLQWIKPGQQLKKLSEVLSDGTTNCLDPLQFHDDNDDLLHAFSVHF